MAAVTVVGGTSPRAGRPATHAKHTTRDQLAATSTAMVPRSRWVGALAAGTDVSANAAGRTKRHASSSAPAINIAPTAIGQDRATLQLIQASLTEHLYAIKQQPRSEVLHFCADTVLFTEPILNTATLGAIAEHIIEICQERRWI
jgi:hypothetical protein